MAAAVVLLSACGGSDEDSSASELERGQLQRLREQRRRRPTRSSARRPPPSRSGSAPPSTSRTRPASAQALQEGAAEIRAIEPPAEIAADWNALADGLEQIAAAFAEVDLTDPAAQQALGQKIAELQGPLDTASTNVETYLRDECGLELDSGESAAPSS